MRGRRITWEIARAIAIVANVFYTVAYLWDWWHLLGPDSGLVTVQEYVMVTGYLAMLMTGPVLSTVVILWHPAGTTTTSKSPAN